MYAVSSARQQKAHSPRSANSDHVHPKEEKQRDGVEDAYERPERPQLVPRHVREEIEVGNEVVVARHGRRYRLID